MGFRGSNNLIVLVPFASDNEHISGSSSSQRGLNGAPSIHHHHIPLREVAYRGWIIHLLHARLDQPRFGFSEDAPRIFGSWVVRGQHHHVAEATSCFSHKRAFPSVSVAATSENGQQAS